ncbi:GNAT family acetyltransferase [Rhizobium sp. Root274]|uniref:GNAT family N-acetyltransferase n=1 Tax=unclassified Rhizobium TaxID=2613769 RepID=UPI00071523A6|nr:MULTISPECIES: GNAT family N-acetyltransferase [unclassified Rhizobium]KQW28834.1 GNAT family acetyltransferase [Rhizobium sp. Root1240]KRD29030.1 GNAT family acetyltransferase [Rhizobium sp. Root274]
MQQLTKPAPVSSASSWPEGLVIRPSTPADAQQIADFHNLPGYRAGTLRLPYQPAEDVRKTLEQPRGEAISLVAVMDEIIVGDIGLVRATGRRAHAATVGMGVHDAYQRRGIGRALLGEIVAIADDWLDLRRLELAVFCDNKAAIGLYQSFGFETEGVYRSYAFRSGAYVDAFAMARLR